VTAAVVGVILNLAVWFALQVLFAEHHSVKWLGASIDVPVLASANIPSMLLATAAAIGVFRFKFGMVPVLLASSLAGIVVYLIAGGI
jgi:chromate transporter